MLVPTTRNFELFNKKEKKTGCRPTFETIFDKALMLIWETLL